MPIIERELTGWELPSDTPKAGSDIKSFSLISSPGATFKGFGFTLSFPLANAYRVLLMIMSFFPTNPPISSHVYLLQSHPQYYGLYDKDALFHDPFTDKPVITGIWASGLNENHKGSWGDLTSKVAREWWSKGRDSLIERGVDGLWNDNNEDYLHDDEFMARNEFPHQIASPAPDGNVKVGLLGRMINVEMMAKLSGESLTNANPKRRSYILTRSANVGTFEYSCATWTGDNETSWHTLRGSQAIQLNCGMSLIQSTGSDVGGFGGPLPSPELFVRWVQLGVTHARFCIHSWKPTKGDKSGALQTNTPWMVSLLASYADAQYPEVLPIVRKEIKWRYEHLPFFNSLMWDSHLNANPTNAWVGWGNFASDPRLYEKDCIESFDAWIGAGRILSAPALFEGVFTRDLYFPKDSPHDQSLYFDLNSPHGIYKAGTTAHISVPIEHSGLYAREGAVIPIGKDYHTVTQAVGSSRTTTDGVDVVLETEGGVVGIDGWRGVKIFPGPRGSYLGHWIEDDGISADPEKTVIEIEYAARNDEEVEVCLTFAEHGFKGAWGQDVVVVLPVTDTRHVRGAKEVTWKDRSAWLVRAESA